MDFGLGLFIGMFIMWVIAMKLKAEWKRDLEKLKDYETLEEAAERYVHGGIYLNEPEKQQTEIAFYEGAKWQAKKMYSEEEVISILYSFHKENNSRVVFSLSGITKWFEQFKKK